MKMCLWSGSQVLAAMIIRIDLSSQISWSSSCLMSLSSWRSKCIVGTSKKKWCSKHHLLFLSLTNVIKLKKKKSVSSTSSLSSVLLNFLLLNLFPAMPIMPNSDLRVYFSSFPLISFAMPLACRSPQRRKIGQLASRKKETSAPSSQGFEAVIHR